MAERVVALTLCDPPGETTHWTGRLMAKVAGVGLTSVQRIWKAHGLAPHRIRAFKLSNDPKFAAKVRDIVGLYVDPPAHSVVLSVDEKSQIQALDRTQPGLPMKKGRAGTMTHDYKSHGTTTLFAAFDILKGNVIGRCTQRHRHQEFIRFLNAVEGFFAMLTRRRLKRGVFKGVVDLRAAINRFVVDYNLRSKPFVWTADPDKIIAAAARGHQVLESIR
jgi:hypothetical protein